MAFLDDKRFILSHIRHSFITCDDTGMCETVMLSEEPNRYRTSSLYPQMNSLLESDDDSLNDIVNDSTSNIGLNNAETGSISEEPTIYSNNNALNTTVSPNNDNKTVDNQDLLSSPVLSDKQLAFNRDKEMQRDLQALELLQKAYRKYSVSNVFVFDSDSDDSNASEIMLLKQTEIDYKSELLEDNPPQSLDILSSSFDITGSRRRSNTAQKLEKMKKERKFHSKTKSIPWRCSTKDVIAGDGTTVKKIVLNAELLAEEDLTLLEYDPVLKVYYETLQYRQKLFPINAEAIKKVDDNPKVQRFETILEQKESGDSVDSNKENEDTNSPEETSSASSPNETQPSKKPKERRRSALSLAIQLSPKAPLNPFNEYFRFDGSVLESNAPTKRIRIFFHIFNEEEMKSIDFTKHSAVCMVATGKNWIEIVVLASAKISDLIGLICWQYTHLNIGPALKTDLSYYALKIAEENGDVDTDFPSLNPQDDIKRYGFPYLALVEVQTNITVTVTIEPDNVFSQIISNTNQMTIGEVVEQIKKKRPQLFRQEPNVFVELKNPSSVNTLGVQGSTNNGCLDMGSKLCDYVRGNVGKLALVMRLASRASSISKSPLLETDFKNDHFQMSSSSKLRSNRSFSFLGDHSQSPQSSPLPRKPTKDWSQNMLDLMEAPVYQSFNLYVRHNFNWIPIEMGISSSKVELNPKQTSSGRLQFLTRFNQPFKPLTIDIKDVMKTHFSSRQKASVRANFKLYYWNGNDYKSLKFGGDLQVVDDILCKIDNLMRMFVSPRRNDYLSTKTRKYKTLTPRRLFRSRASSSSSNTTSSSSSTTSNESQDDDDNNKKSKSRVFRLRGSG